MTGPFAHGIALALILVFCNAFMVIAQPLQPFSKFVETNRARCAGTANLPCTIPSNARVLISAQDVTVRSLTVFGTLVIRPSEGNPNVRVDTAFLIASGSNATINITAPSWTTRVQIYLRRNPNAYADVPLIPQRDMFTGGRVFGGANGARIFVEGAKIKRTFSLLSKHVFSQCGLRTCAQPGSNGRIFVTDDVSEWKSTYDLVISPSDQQYGVWVGQLAIRPGAFQGKIVKVTNVSTKNGGPEWQIDLDRPIPYYNFSALNPTFPYVAPISINGYGRDNFPVYYGDRETGMQSEVFVLNRNILFTGDDFTSRWAPLQPPAWPGPNNSPKTNGWPVPWSPYANSTALVEGLHTLIAGMNCTQYEPCQSGGGWIKMRYARVEKAGQRGWIGRYPLHLHRMGNCPMCEFTGNVVFNTQQRGITVHSTGNAVVQDNIVFNMKGAGIYIEEGTEIGNTIQRNVVVCGSGVQSYTYWNTTFNNWQLSGTGLLPGVSQGGGTCQPNSLIDFGDPSVILGGCRITGTDNEQADCVQQAGIWALSATNSFIENRISNNYNCIYTQSTMFKDGRLGTDSLHRVCPMHSNFGEFRKNVCHSHQRFGFYPDVNYPRNLARSEVGTNGYVADLVTNPLCMEDLTSKSNWCSCRANTLDGRDNAQNLTYIEDQLDWGNAFVGQYDLADVQYLRYRSHMNNIGMYWKGSKTMKDGKSAHIKNSSFGYLFSIPQNILPIAPWAGSNAVYFLNTPGISGTIIVENVNFSGSPGSADWIQTGDSAGSSGGALGVNQQCKGYLSGVAEGGICTPQVLLINVNFAGIQDVGSNPDAVPPQPQNQRPSWIQFGAESGNPFLGMVVTFDDSLCGGRMTPCPFKSVLPRFTTHLLNLPGTPCSATMAPIDKSLPNNNTDADWSRRFYNGITCKVQTRRLTIWGQGQGSNMNPIDLVLIPPGKSRKNGFNMTWIAFNRAYNAQQGPCPWSGVKCPMGTDWPVNEPRSFAEGYGAAVIPEEYFSTATLGPWTLIRADGRNVNVTQITMVELSDTMFDGRTFPGPDTLRVQLNAGPGGRLCVLKSTDPRPFMTQYGPTTKNAGGSCVNEWLLAKDSPVQTKFPTRFPTNFPRLLL